MKNAGYRIIAHPAEVGLAVRGRTWPEFYLNAARGLLAVYSPAGNPGRVRTTRVSVHGDAAEDALVAWLNEIIFLVSAKRWMPSKIRILKAQANALEAELTGGNMGSGPGRGVRIIGEVKAATFGGLKVRCLKGHRSALIILDV